MRLLLPTWWIMLYGTALSALRREVAHQAMEPWMAL